MAQRPLLATVNVAGPFQVLSRPLTLRPKPAAPPPPAGPASDPVAWWRFDEAGGRSAADASGHGHTGQARGDPCWAAGQGRTGGALELDGAQSYLDCGDAPAFDFRDGLTVSLWLKPHEFKKPGRTIIAKGNDTWSLRSAGDTGKLVYALRGPQTTGQDRRKAPQAASKRALDDGQWHHVAGVYDGQRIALYVDGQLEESVTASGPLAINTEPVWLGNNSAARDEWYKGWLDDVRLYGSGLTEDAIHRLHAEPAK